MTVAVLGSGISGLAASYYLSKTSNCSVKLLESSSRVGGWIKSLKIANGTIFEGGPRTIRLAGIPGLNTLELLEELQLEKEVLPVLSSQPAARNRMLYVNGNLHSLPNSVTSLFKTVPPFTKPLATAVLNDLTAKPKKLEDDTIYNFVSRRFGPEIAEYAVSALVCGVCAGDAQKISVNLLMSSLFEFEQAHGGVIKGVLKSAFSSKKEASGIRKGKLAERSNNEKWNVWSLRGGLETLPKTIADVLNKSNAVNVLLNSHCDKIDFTSDGAKLDVNGKAIHAQHVFSGIPSKKLASLLSNDHAILKEELSQIPYVTVAVVNLEYSGHVLPVDAFGFLVPPNQKLPILGVIFDTCCFPQGDKTVLTVMMGGAWFTQLFGDNPEPETLLRIAESQVKKSLRITDVPANSKVSILRDCIPQYIVGHKARVERIRSYVEAHKLPLTLMGASYDGVGVNDVILSARKGITSYTNILA